MKKLLKVFEIVSMSYVNKYLISITLKFQTTVSGCPTIPLVCQHFLGVFLRRLFLLPLTLMCQIIDFLKEFFTWAKFFRYFFIKPNLGFSSDLLNLGCNILNILVHMSILILLMLWYCKWVGDIINSH